MTAIDFRKMITAEDQTRHEAEAQRATRQANARAYLTETDWVVIRLIETGTAIPAEIRAQRDAARTAIG